MENSFIVKSYWWERAGSYVVGDPCDNCVSPSPKNWVLGLFTLGLNLGSGLRACWDRGLGLGLELDKNTLSMWFNALSISTSRYWSGSTEISTLRVLQEYTYLFFGSNITFIYSVNITPSISFKLVWECSCNNYTTFVGVLPQKWYSICGTTPKQLKTKTLGVLQYRPNLIGLLFKPLLWLKYASYRLGNGGIWKSLNCWFRNTPNFLR